MRNGKIIVGTVCSTLVLGAMIILSANGAWGEERGVASGLTTPDQKVMPVQTAPADPSARPKLPDISCWKHHGSHDRCGGSIPAYRPNPTVDHKVQIMKPNREERYTMKVIRPNSGLDNTVSATPSGNSAEKAWKSAPGSVLPDQPGTESGSSGSGASEQR